MVLVQRVGTEKGGLPRLADAYMNLFSTIKKKILESDYLGTLEETVAADKHLLI